MLITNGNKKIPDKPFILPVMPLKNTVIFPHQVVPLVVGRAKSLKLIEDASSENRLICLVAQKDGNIDDPKIEDLYSFGTVANIIKVFRIPDGSQHVVVQGLTRVHINKFVKSEPFFEAEVSPSPEEVVENVTIEALKSNLKTQVQKVIEIAPHLSSELGVLILNTDDPNHLADLVASLLNISIEDKQMLLEMTNPKKRLEIVTRHVGKELQVLELGKKIQSQVQGEIDKTQRDFYLREQMKAIQKELGEEDEHASEISELTRRIDAANMPDDVREVARKEVQRLSKMPPAAGEYTVIRTYLDWLLDMPWRVETTDNLKVKDAARILDADHYGLDKVKKRILEYLAVRQLKADMKGPILCFVGPPGVGKTSLGRSIARALGRKFVRISLGGIRDEAEIRGHRRTYIGALPGRIIQGIKRASSGNPVFMLDEIDKVGTDFRGDPSSALLEVLDPEQNNAFSDHYLDVPFDLSKVMFIATANLQDPIIPALRDRMEILNIPGYTLEEKLLIARKFLVPKQLEEHGLKRTEYSFSDKALKIIIDSYTREAGVRNLEREIANVCRALAKERVEENGTGKGGVKRRKVRRIAEQDVFRYLGAVKFFSDTKERTSKSGVATGLAWTSAGGDILFIEATRMPGKGRLNLTGSLGDVMKESAQAALSLIRSKSKEYKIPEDFHEKNDIHVHVPSGAIPKDGPSAGVTIFTALYSLLTEKKVRHDVAMTGEITLRGLVLPVGGIKEKVLAAKRAGLRHIVLPEKNRKDLEEIPETLRKKMHFHFVKEAEELLAHVIVK